LNSSEASDSGSDGFFAGRGLIRLWRINPAPAKRVGQSGVGAGFMPARTGCPNSKSLRLGLTTAPAYRIRTPSSTWSLHSSFRLCSSWSPGCSDSPGRGSDLHTTRSSRRTFRSVCVSCSYALSCSLRFRFCDRSRNGGWHFRMHASAPATA
jgi:hypothetical protein